MDHTLVRCKRRNSIRHSPSDHFIHRDSVKILLRPYIFFCSFHTNKNPSVYLQHTHTQNVQMWKILCVCFPIALKKRDANLDFRTSTRNNPKIIHALHGIPHEPKQMWLFPGFYHIFLRKYREKYISFSFVREKKYVKTVYMWWGHIYTGVYCTRMKKILYSSILNKCRILYENVVFASFTFFTKKKLIFLENSYFTRIQTTFSNCVHQVFT